MSNAIKARIMGNVRQRVETGHASYICLALDDIKELDHRRNIQTMCDELKADVQHRIAPHASIGDWLTASSRAPRGSGGKPKNLADVKAARLALIDRMINDLQKEKQS
jgi:hypothetical protein